MPYNKKNWDEHEPPKKSIKPTDEEKSYLNLECPCSCTEAGDKSDWQWSSYSWNCSKCGEPNEQ